MEGQEDHKEDIQNVIKEYHDRWRTILQMLTGHEVNIQADVVANLCSIGLSEPQSLASKTNIRRKIYNFYQEWVQMANPSIWNQNWNPEILNP